MPKIRLIKIKEFYYEDSYSQELYENPLSDWVEVTDDELEFLRGWEGRNLLREDDTRLVIWEDVSSRENVLSYVKDIKEFIKKEKEAAEKRKKKREESEALRKKKAEETKLRKAEELLRKHKRL